jgi:hypothetical protein
MLVMLVPHKKSSQIIRGFCLSFFFDKYKTGNSINTVNKDYQSKLI